MLLTLYYMTTTWMQAWRLRSISTKLSSLINQQMTIVYYNIQNQENGGEIMFNATPTSSELCANYKEARITDLLWHHQNQRGAALLPKQKLHLDSWITFPKLPNLIPFDISENLELRLDQENEVHLLLETNLIPVLGNNLVDEKIIKIENFGIPIAWKIDSIRFSIILKSDNIQFTKLLITSFIQNCLKINDYLSLIRIESVAIEGIPQIFDSIKLQTEKECVNRCLKYLTTQQWEKHVFSLRYLSILAEQATELEYGKIHTDLETEIGNTATTQTITSTNDNDSIKYELMETPSIVLTKKPSPKTSPCALSSLKLILEVDDMAINQDNTLTKKQQQQLTLDNPIETTSALTRSPSKHLIEKCLSSSNAKNYTQDDINCDKPIIELESHNVETIINTLSTIQNGAPRPSLKRSKGVTSTPKPPNVLVYSESIVTRDNVINTLKNILEKDIYTIYPLLLTEIKTKIWMDNAILLIVCGSVTQEIGVLLTEYFLKGGNMFCLCSDVLHIVLPTYRTAEIREQELAQFSYGRWQKIKMMHHIFCYQPSPVKKYFSTDSECDMLAPIVNKIPVLMCPTSVDVKDLQGNQHSLQVQVLGTEETWNTPSLMLACNKNTTNGGKAIFSQVHLEIDPNIYEHDESKYLILKENNKARLEILSDILHNHLNMSVLKTMISIDNNNINIMNTLDNDSNVYFNGYFLGRHELKFEFLEKLKSKMNSRDDNILKLDKLTLQFCGKNDGIPPKATNSLLPILIHSCPEDFSTVEYFDNLKSDKIGRIVIYTPIITSTMNVLTNMTLSNGLVVIARQQTKGNGRNNNQWLSPTGCAMFSIQLHIPLATPLGQKIPLLQHLVATAIVNAVLNIKGYESLDIRLKWPNDIYADGNIKIGGLIINTQIDSSQAICNIGCGINLNNSKPTKCINDIIKEYNQRNDSNLPCLQYEKFFAIVFNEIEKLVYSVQTGELVNFYQIYYKLWLHSNAEVTVIDVNGCRRRCKITGIDDYGFLVVIPVDGNNNKAETVHPDGNSFDMLQGLILPK